MFSQVLSMEKTRTLPIAVYNFVSYAEVDWGGVMAAAVAIMAPAIILTMIFQKYVVQGLTMGRRQGLRITRSAFMVPGRVAHASNFASIVMLRLQQLRHRAARLGLVRDLLELRVVRAREFLRSRSGGSR